MRTSAVQPGGQHRPLGQRPQLVHVDVGLLHLRVETGDLQQILGQPAHGPDTVLHHLGRAAGRQQLGRHVQPGQRGAQLMGHIGGETLLAVQLALERGGHRVECGRHRGGLVLGMRRGAGHGDRPRGRRDRRR